jgi:L-ascorbate metabolism protein UlaG (beta-lactamase superfamily)
MRNWSFRRKILAAVAVLVLGIGAAVSWYAGHPAGPAKDDYLQIAIQPVKGVSATFYGTTTLLFRDDHNAVMVDAFISRPGLGKVLGGEVATDPALVRNVFGKVRHVDLLLVSHSHYDHALDAPAVAALTGATLVGSPSTREIGLGGGLPEARIRTMRGGETMTAGAFSVRIFRSLHSPGDRVPGTIDAPLSQPASVKAYKQGGTFAYLIERGGVRILVHPSANFVPGMYRGVKAEVVFLSVGGLGSQSKQFVADYWRETVAATGAKMVVPIHWDDFLRPLDQPMLPLRRFMDDFPAAMAKVMPLAQRDHVAVRYMPVAWAVDIGAYMEANR